MAEAAGVRRPRDQRDVGLDPFEARLHATHQVLETTVRPVEVATIRGIVHVHARDRTTTVAPIAVAAVPAVAAATVVQSVEAEGRGLRELLEDLGQHVDEEVAVGSEDAEHAAVRVLLEVDFRNRRRVGGNTPPVRVLLPDFPLERRRIDAEHTDAESLVLGEIGGERRIRDVRRAARQVLAVVESVERIDEAELAQPHAVRGGLLAHLSRARRERVPGPEDAAHPLRHRDRPQGRGLERLRRQSAVHEDVSADGGRGPRDRDGYRDEHHRGDWSERGEARDRNPSSHERRDS